MRCSNCKKEGHNKRSCKIIVSESKNDTEGVDEMNNYSKKTIRELKKICKDLKIKGISKKNKKELIDLLQQKENIQVSVAKVIESVKENVYNIDDTILQTEDTGKIFEMSICLAYGIQYDGKYKYCMKMAEKLKPRLYKLTKLFPMCRHSAKKGARYDFTCLNDGTIHLSAKTTKRGVGKVAPQVIGQSQPRKFCEIIGIEYTTIPLLKQYIQTEILKITPILVNYTFDCPNIYYNQEKNTIRYITLTSPIEWDKYQYKWTCIWTEWNNSSTLKVIFGENEFSLIEFQFHTKSRTNMAIRWFYENFLTIFKNNFNIIDI